MHTYPNTDTTTVRNNLSFILSGISDFDIVDNLSTVVHTLPMRMFTSLSVDEILLPKYMNWFINFRDLPFNEKLLK